MILKNTPTAWSLDLCRANNHNKTALSELQKVLKPIEEAEKMEQNFKSENSRKNDKEKKNTGGKRDQPSGNACRKAGHNYEWKYCSDNWANQRSRNESNTQEKTSRSCPRARDSSRERSTVNNEDQYHYFMDYESSSESESDEMPGLTLREDR